MLTISDINEERFSDLCLNFLFYQTLHNTILTTRYYALGIQSLYIVLLVLIENLLRYRSTNNKKKQLDINLKNRIFVIQLALYFPEPVFTGKFAGKF